MDKLSLYIACLRPTQWTKNLVLIAALIFSRNLFRFQLTLRSIEALAIFCLLSGSIYIFNDLVDFERDRAHPVKRNRPIASGRVSKRGAFLLGVFAVVAGLVLASFLNRGFFNVSFSRFDLCFGIQFDAGIQECLVLSHRFGDRSRLILDKRACHNSVDDIL